MTSTPSDDRHLIGEVVALDEVRAFVVGDILLDEYVEGEVRRISPEAPVPVVLEHKRRVTLGGAANVAAGLAALGVDAHLAGRVGEDAEGRLVGDLCRSHGVDTEALVASADVCTARKTRVLAGWQQLFRLDREDVVALDTKYEQTILGGFSAFCAVSSDRAVLVLSDYGKGVLTPALLSRLIASAEDHAVPVVVDPKSSDLARYSGATVIKPNLFEALRVAEEAAADEMRGFERFVRLAETFRAKSGTRNVVLSLAGDGVLVVGDDVLEPELFHSVALEVSDVSGAGDTMVAVLAATLASGLPLPRAVELANVAAGAACAKAGTATLTAAELISAYQSTTRGTSTQKVLADAAEAARLAELERRAERTVVFTNGCFDVLHAGHLRLLAEARRQGDFLLVGLNSDAGVRRLKGPSRPVQSQDDRAEILAGLSSVDAVVVFDEDTPLELIRRVRPHVLVKGADYRSEDVVGGADVSSWGGRVHLAPLLEGRSSTRLLTARSESQPRTDAAR